MVNIVNKTYKIVKVLPSNVGTSTGLHNLNDKPINSFIIKNDTVCNINGLINSVYEKIIKSDRIYG